MQLKARSRDVGSKIVFIYKIFIIRDKLKLILDNLGRRKYKSVSALILTTSLTGKAEQKETF